MIITLIGADFSKSNIGTLSSWIISRVLGDGATYAGPSYVDKDAALSATITLDEGYEIGSAGITITMGGTALDESCYSVVDNVITFTIDSVTGSVVIKVPTLNTNTGEEDGGNTGGEGGGNEDEGETTIAYTSRQSSSGISKTTGEYLSSSTGYVNIYENIDPAKSYFATSYAPGTSGDNACVCYYTSDGTFISAQDGTSFGVNSAEYTDKQLSVPSNAAIIKLFGRTNNQEALLKTNVNIAPIPAMQEITYTSQNTTSNLNKNDGTLGSSTSGYVNVYTNIDATKTYYASGFCPNATGTAASVCYYTSDETFISAQDGNDFGLSSANFVKQKLTVPTNTAIIKIFAQSTSGYTPAALYIKL